MDLKKLVYAYPTKNKGGFTKDEQKSLLKKFPGINMEKYNNAMFGNTCMMVGEELIMYHCDVLTALRCGIENRDMTWLEMD